MSSSFELHPACGWTSALDAVAWTESASPAEAPVPRPFAVAATESTLVWARPEHAAGGALTRAEAASALVGFRFLPRPVGAALGVLLPQGGWINGLPAMRFAVLHARDLLSLPDGTEHYVTERIVPHFGPAAAEMLGRKCPVCRTKIEAGSFVLSCRCGAIMHWETAETTPDTPAEARWDCAVQLKTCLACGQALTREPYLVWDPSDWQQFGAV